MSISPVSEFSEFYAAHKDRCLRAVVASGMERDRAEDAVAEAFATAWSQWRAVRRTDSPTAWVVRTAINQNISWWRKRRRELLIDPSLDHPGAGSPGAGEQGDGRHGTDEPGRVDLVAAIRSLPPRQREVVVLRYLLDLDTRTTARELGVAPGTVGAHLHHALASLREHLTTSEGTPL